MYKVLLLPAAQKFFQKLSKTDKSSLLRIVSALDSLRSDPTKGKALKHKLKGKCSLRVGVYRIIYKVVKKQITVFVLDIGHRREIY